VPHPSGQRRLLRPFPASWHDHGQGRSIAAPEDLAHRYGTPRGPRAGAYSATDRRCARAGDAEVGMRSGSTVTATLRRHLFALGVVAVAVAVRLALEPWLAPGRLPYLLVFGAVALAVWRAGPAAALVAAAAGFVAINALLPGHLAARPGFGVDQAYALFAYAVSVGVVVAFGAAMRRAQRERTEHTQRLSAAERETRLASDQLRRTLHEMQTLVGASPIAIVTIDPDPPIVRSWNPAAQALFGWSAEETIGRPAPFVPADVQDECSAYRRELAAGATVHDAPVQRLRRDGTTADLRLSAAPMRDADGRVHALLLMFVDDSQGRRAARADARFAAVVRDATEAVIAMAPDGTVEAWNPAAERLFGIGAHEVIGRRVPELVPRDRRAEQRDMWDAVLRGESRRVETQRLTRSGELLDVWVGISPIRDEREAIVGVSALVLDLTERKRADEALRRSEALLRAMYEGTTMCMGVVELLEDDDVLHLQDNAGTCRVFGVPPGGTVNRRGSELGASAATLKRWAAHYRESARRGAPVTFEYPSQGPTGIGWHRATVTPLPGAGARPRFTYLSEDITARHAADMLVRQREAQARLALEVAEIGTWSWNPHDDAVEADVRVRRIAGLPSRGPLRMAQLLDRVHAQDRPAVEAALRDALDPHGEGAYAAEFRFVHDDADPGDEHWVVSRGQLLATGPDAAPMERLMLCTAIDITARKRTEQALADSDRRKSEFLATLAHELRNPLAPMRNALAIVELAGDEAPTRERSLGILQRQLGLMVRMIDDLLDLSRINRDQLDLRLQPVDLASIVQGGLETSQPLIAAQGHQLSVKLPSHPVIVEGDAARLTQVVANLLNNAAKYTPAGGQLQVEVLTGGFEASVAIEDTGIGIPRDMLARVFDMFAQVDRSMAPSRAGLGIGLAISRRLAELHGGSLAAFSEGEGLGSRFVLRLPLAQAADVPPAGDAAGRREAPVGRRVLVVDDNADAADTLVEVLALQGHAVQAAYRGEAALELAERWRPEVVLLDIGMPEMDGYEVARRLKARPWAVGTIVVALTGWGQDSDRMRTRASGFDHHLVKPVEPDEIERLIGAATAR
jgi:PAS domain S-box-containing protein